MTVSVTAVEWVDAYRLRLAWESDLSAPTFYVYRDGVLALTTTGTSAEFAVESGASPVFEIIDTAAAASPAWPQRLTLYWRPVADAETYRIEEYVDGGWTARDTVRESGAGEYTWRTRVLEDDTSHQLRVVPVGENGNDGSPLSFACLMVRHPDPPDPDFTYDDGTQAVTITE